MKAMRQAGGGENAEDFSLAPLATPGLAAGAAGVAALGGPGFVAAGFDVALHAGLEAADAGGCEAVGIAVF